MRTASIALIGAALIIFTVGLGAQPQPGWGSQPVTPPNTQWAQTQPPTWQGPAPTPPLTEEIVQSTNQMLAFAFSRPQLTPQQQQTIRQALQEMWQGGDPEEIGYAAQIPALMAQIQAQPTMTEQYRMMLRNEMLSAAAVDSDPRFVALITELNGGTLTPPAIAPSFYQQPGIPPTYEMPGAPQLYQGQPVPGQQTYEMPGAPQLYQGQPVPGQQTYEMPGAPQLYQGQPAPGQQTYEMPGAPQLYQGQQAPGQQTYETPGAPPLYQGQTGWGQQTYETPGAPQLYQGQPAPGQQTYEQPGSVQEAPAWGSPYSQPQQ